MPVACGERVKAIRPMAEWQGIKGGVEQRAPKKAKPPYPLNPAIVLSKIAVTRARSSPISGSRGARVYSGAP